MASVTSTDIAATATATAQQRSEIVARIERLPFSRAHWHIASILSVGTFFDAFDAICIATALTVIFTSLHIGFFNAGLLISSAYVGQFVGAWAFGFMSEAYGRKIAFVIAIFLFGILSIATAFAWDFQSLVTLRVIQGLGLGGEVPVAAALFNEFLRTEKRGRIALMYQLIFIWGAMLTPVIGLICFSLFGQELGWRVMFLFGGMPALVAIYAWFALPESPRWLVNRGRYAEADGILRRIETQPWDKPLPAPQLKPQPELRQTRFGELFAGIYLKRTIMLWTLWACAYFVAYGFSIWLPTLYVNLGGLPVNYALALSVVSWAITLSTMYTQAFLLDVIGRKPLLILGFTLITIGATYGALMVFFLHATSWQVLFSVAVILSLGTSLTTSPAVNYTAELYPTRMRGLGVSTASSMNRLASIFAPASVGAIMAAQLGIQTVFAMFACVGLIGFTMMAILGVETKNRSLEELSP
jgi:MFS transporter, putative metabolite:H+ symporter